MSGVIFVNPDSGRDGTDVDDLRQRFGGHRVEETEPGDLPDAVAKAVAANVDFVGVAGGDGTIRSAVQVLLRSRIPLIPIPTGTRNHFARTVGIHNLDDAVGAVDGVVVAVDVGEVNGDCFVNNSSLGVYPKLVAAREARERRFRKSVANVVAAFEQWRGGQTLDVEVDGSVITAWLVFVGNGSYGHGVLDLGARASLADHVLDLRIVRAGARLSRLRVVAALLLGRLERSPLILRKETPAVTLTVREDKAEVALDGEVVTMVSPLRYRTLVGALDVLTPLAAE